MNKFEKEPFTGEEGGGDDQREDNTSKAWAMAHAEEQQREINKRRERAGMPVDPEKIDRVKKEAEDRWEEKERKGKKDADYLMQYYAKLFNAFIDDKEKQSIRLPSPFVENKTLFNKLQKYLGKEFKKIEFDKDSYPRVEEMFSTEDNEITVYLTDLGTVEIHRRKID